MRELLQRSWIITLRVSPEVVLGLLHILTHTCAYTYIHKNIHTPSGHNPVVGREQKPHPKVIRTVHFFFLFWVVLVIESSKVGRPRRSEIKLVDFSQPVDVHIATQKNKQCEKPRQHEVYQRSYDLNYRIKRC